MPNPNYDTFYKKNNNEDYLNDFYKNDPNYYNNKYNQFYRKNNFDNEEHNNYNNNKKYFNKNRNNEDYNIIYSIDNNNNNLLNSQYFNINNKKEKEKINKDMIKSENIKTHKIYTNNDEHQITPLKLKFKYKSDFDKNGALYYIGTYGLSREYKNPHELKLIKAFGSSLKYGNYSDFVGRKLVNLSTENEENSFFGVDLGPDRYLLPTYYSIRNRDSSSNVLLCWNLQGSNDKINFEILDKRIFNNENDRNRDKYRKYRNLLKEPGTTSTWGINKKIREKFPNGFRYFLLKQIDKNSSGNYNLAISGFELYGDAIGNGWNFS